MLRTPKRIIPILIVLFWLVMLGGLLYREVALPYLYRGLVSSRVIRPQNIWLGLYFGEDQRVGFVNLRTVPEDRNFEAGYAMNVIARFEIPLFGTNTRFQLNGGAWQSAQAGLREFNFHINADGHEMVIKGTAEEGVISGTFRTGGEEIPFSLPVGREVLLSGGMGLNSLSIPALEPGEVAYVDTFDPTAMSVGRARIEALRRETLTVGGAPVETVVIATTVAGFTTLAWISDDEEVIRAETPIGLIIKKITSEEAFAPMQPDESANMIRALSIMPTGPAPDPDADLLRLRIIGDAALLPPEDGRQWRDGDAYVLIRQDPGDASRNEPLTDEESVASLASDLFIQADHSRIIAAADDIVGDADTAWEKAVRIYAWMYDNIAKEHVLSLPSALDVLEQRKGDCNEHAVLYAALARAVGIPTRVVIGLAWSRTLQAFGYHAWVEVYVGQWIAMDPTFGEKVAGPTHIKLITGSIDQWPRLLAYIGALAIEVVGDETDATALQ